jgi:hypothetical protein
MNQTQKNYLSARINAIGMKLIAEVKIKYTKKAKKVTTSDMLKMAIAGKVKPNKGFDASDFYGNGRKFLARAFDFSDSEDKVDQVKIDAAIKKISAKLMQTNDMAILGDSDEAVKLLSDLESFKI